MAETADLRSLRRLADHTSVALTFDDGPQAASLPAFLTVLADQGVRASFFVVGSDVERDPALLEEIAAAGHSVHNHGYRHRNHLLRNPLGVPEDIERGADAIAQVLGHRPPLFRPPQGVITPFTRRGARAAGERIVLWSRWGRDWRRRASADSIVRDLVDGVRGGDVLLLHDADHYSSTESWKRTLQALPRVIERVRESGLSFVALESPTQLVR